MLKLVSASPWSKAIIDKAIRVMKFFKNHTFTSAEVRRRTIEKDGRPMALILHGKTRIAGLYYVLKRLEDLCGIMKEICVSDG